MFLSWHLTVILLFQYQDEKSRNGPSTLNSILTVVAVLYIYIFFQAILSLFDTRKSSEMLI